MDATVTLYSIKVASISQGRQVKRQKASETHDIFKGRIDLKNQSLVEYNSILVVQKLHELQKKAWLLRGNKAQEDAIMSYMMITSLL